MFAVRNRYFFKSPESADQNLVEGGSKISFAYLCPLQHKNCLVYEIAIQAHFNQFLAGIRQKRQWLIFKINLLSSVFW